jgi:transcriptional regulator with XRE-family HTH domain
MVTALKWAILDYGEPMYKIAMKARMSESRLSRLSTGLFEPKDAEKQALSIVLNVPVDILFPLISRRFENKERKDGR